MGTSLGAVTCCLGPRVRGEVRRWRNYGQESSRPAGSGRRSHNYDRCPSGAGARAGTPGGNRLSRPSRSDPQRAASAKSRRCAAGTERRHPHRPSCHRTSPSSPSWRPCLRPGWTARAPPPSPPSPPPLSWVLSKRRASGADALCKYFRPHQPPRARDRALARAMAYVAAATASPLNQISHPGHRRAPSHRQARTIPRRILVKRFVDHDRTDDHDRHSQTSFERCIHVELLPRRSANPAASFLFRAAEQTGCGGEKTKGKKSVSQSANGTNR